MDLKTALFVAIASLTGISAVGVVVSQNIVRSAAWLLFTLAGTAGIYFLIGADFVGGTQLIVYVGGILVLVVFGVMLTAQGPFISMKSGAAEWAITMVVGLLFLGVLSVTILRTEWPVLEKSARMNDPAGSKSSAHLGQAFLGVKEVMAPADLQGMPERDAGHRTQVGFLLPFEIISVHLLVVLIGAAYLARAKRRPGAVS